MLEVLSFNYNDPLVHDFKAFAIDLYSDDQYRTKSEEIFPEEYNTTFFMIKDKEKTIARACAIINPDIEYQNKEIGLIGFYDCINSHQASKILLDNIFKHFKTINIDYVIGPLNGSTWKSYRFTEPSNNPPFFLDNYHKHWYSKQFKDFGFETISRYSSTIIGVSKEKTPERIKKFNDYYQSKGLNIRPMSIKNFEQDLKKIYEISIESFKNNFLYTPISYEKFFHMYKEIKFFMDPELSLIAELEDGSPCGFVFTIDNMFDKEKKSLVIKSVGTLPCIKCRGMGTYLVERIHSMAMKKGYEYLIHALMHEDNVSSNVLSELSKIFHRYSLFGKAL